MKPDDDSHDFAETQFAFSDAFSGAILQQSLVEFWLEFQTEVMMLFQSSRLQKAICMIYSC